MQFLRLRLSGFKSFVDPTEFRIENVTRRPSLAHLRWTVDLPEDLDFVRHVYGELYPNNPAFLTEDIAALPRNSLGRTTFKNAGRTERQGLEIAAETLLAGPWHAELAFTRLDAVFADS